MSNTVRNNCNIAREIILNKIDTFMFYGVKRKVGSGWMLIKIN